MFRHLRVIFPLLFLFCNFSACSSLWHLSDTEDKQPLESISAKPPVSVSVLSSAIVNGELQVAVGVTPKTYMQADNIAIALLGLEEGVVIQRRVKLLREVYGDGVLEQGKTFQIVFNMPAKNLSEYQVKVGWGSEAEDLAMERGNIEAPEPQIVNLPENRSQIDNMLAENSVKDLGDARASLAVPETVDHSFKDTIELKSIRLDKDLKRTKELCKTKSCDIYYNVEAFLRNNSTGIIKESKLAIGIFWVNSTDKTPNLPLNFAPLKRNEKEIVLSNLNLYPGKEKKLRIRIDQGIPEIPGGRFVPHIRIVSFESQ